MISPDRAGSSRELVGYGDGGAALWDGSILPTPALGGNGIPAGRGGN